MLSSIPPRNMCLVKAAQTWQRSKRILPSKAKVQAAHEGNRLINDTHLLVLGATIQSLEQIHVSDGTHMGPVECARLKM